MNGNMNLVYPQIGVTDNWGSIVNNNFRYLHNRIMELYNGINEVQALVGTNIPYIKVDNNKFFVKIAKVISDNSIYEGQSGLNTGDIVFRYYKKDPLNYSVYTTYTRINNGEWKDNNKPEIWLCAYIDELQEITGNSASSVDTLEIDTVNFYKNDLIVATKEYGSIYGNNDVIVFKSYPTPGEYYEPVLNNSNPYKLEFRKIPFVDWFKKSSTLEYTLPSIGYGQFVRITYNNSEEKIYINGSEPINGSDELEGTKIKVTLEFNSNLIENAEDVLNNISFKLENGSNIAPAIVDYTSNITQTTEENIKYIQIELTIDKSGLQPNDILHCDIFFSHKDPHKISLYQHRIQCSFGTDSSYFQGTLIILSEDGREYSIDDIHNVEIFSKALMAQGAIYNSGFPTHHIISLTNINDTHAYFTGYSYGEDSSYDIVTLSVQFNGEGASTNDEVYKDNVLNIL